MPPISAVFSVQRHYPHAKGDYASRVSFTHIAAILVRMLGHRRSSGSSSKPRCSNSRPTHRGWNRCSRCQHQRGLTERPTRQGAAQRMPAPFNAMISGLIFQNATIAHSDFHALWACDCRFTVKTQSCFRQSGQSGHRKRGHRRSAGTSAKPRSSKARPTHRGWNRCSRSQHQRGYTH